MTFRHRIALDRLLAVPLCFAFDLAARLLGKILGRNHAFSVAETHQLVVCKLVGMGSIIQATPLLRALKGTFPKARLTFVTLQSNRELVRRLEGVDEVLCLDDRGLFSLLVTTASALWRLMRRRVDHYFDLEVYSGFTSLLSLFSLARNRLGFYRHSSRFKRGLFTHLVYFNTRMAVRRLYLQLGCVAGVPAEASDRLGTIRVESADRAAMREKLAHLGLAPGVQFVLVNPNASDLLIERRWPEKHVVAAINLLAEQGKNMVLLGAPAEAPYVKQIADEIQENNRSRVFNVAGQLSLAEAFALIEAAACVVTNDTGPMHMAFALERPTVCLFGPVDPAHYGVVRPDVVTLYASVSCSPCVHEIDQPPCHGNNVCMQRLSPALVVQNVLALLDQGKNLPKVPHLPLVWQTAAGQPLGVVLRPHRK